MESRKLPTCTRPDIRLTGEINEAMLADYFLQRSKTMLGEPVVLELSTPGGDADTARRIAEELRLWQEEGCELFFLGKTQVFSAGITVMTAISPDYRFLTRGTELLIRERRLNKQVQLDGTLRGCRSVLYNLLAEVDMGQRLEHDDFARLIAGTSLTLDAVAQHTTDRDWHLNAEEARTVGLVAAVI